MGAFEDFINGLEGQENLELPAVVGELLKLHSNEMSTATAKISSLESVIGERDTALAARESELSKAKADNWDLVNQVQVGSNPSTPAPAGEDGKPGPSQITFDDLY